MSKSTRLFGIALAYSIGAVLFSSVVLHFAFHQVSHAIIGTVFVLAMIATLYSLSKIEKPLDVLRNPWFYVIVAYGLAINVGAAGLSLVVNAGIDILLGPMGHSSLAQIASIPIDVFLIIFALNQLDVVGGRLERRFAEYVKQ